jgi:hypothetical protein
MFKEGSFLMVHSVSLEFDKQFFDEFASVPLKRTSIWQGVQCLVRVQGEDRVVSVESKNIARKFWVWVRGTKEEYNLQANIERLADKIQSGIRRVTEGGLDPLLEQKVAACYKRYQILVTYYSHWHVKSRSFTGPDFEERYLSLPVNGLLREFEEKLRSWEREGSDVHRIIARTALNFVDKLKYRVSIEITYDPCVEANFSRDIQRLFAFVKDVSRLDIASSTSICSWLEKMRSEKGYPGLVFCDLMDLEREWEALSLSARERSPDEISLSSLKKFLEERLDALESKRLTIQEKLDEFREEEQFKKWEEGGNEGKRLFATHVRYLVDQKKRDLRASPEEKRSALKQALSLFRQQAMAYVDFPDHKVAQRIEDIRRKYNCDFDHEFLRIESDWADLKIGYRTSTVEPRLLKEKLESATNELDRLLSQFIQKRGGLVVQNIRSRWKALQADSRTNAYKDALAVFVRELYRDADYVSETGALFCTGNGSEIMIFFTTAIKELKDAQYKEIRDNLIHLRKKLDAIVVRMTKEQDLSANSLDFSSVLP